MAQPKNKLGKKWGITESGKTFQKPVIVDHNGDLSKQWHVYFRYWDSDKNELVKSRKSAIKGHLTPNRSQDPKVRYEELTILKKIIERLLEMDWVPHKHFPVSKLVEKDPSLKADTPIPTIDAISIALKAKKGEISDKYYKMLKWRMEIFQQFLKDHDLDQLPISKLSRRHIVKYLSFIQETRGVNGQKASNKTRNGYLGDLSTIFNTLIESEIITSNPCSTIKKLPEKSGRHVPFSSEEIQHLSEWSKVNSPYLYQYIQFIAFAFLRPKEILDLQIRDIDLKNKLIKLRKESAKVDATTIPIIAPLFNTLNEMIPSNSNGHFYLFTLNQVPGPERIAQSRYFSRRFNQWKDYMNQKHNTSFGNDHTLYGIRHTFIQNIFSELRENMTKTEAEFQLMTITRHRTIEALRKYTRDYGMDIAEDWSDKFTLQF